MKRRTAVLFACMTLCIVCLGSILVLYLVVAAQQSRACDIEPFLNGNLADNLSTSDGPLNHQLVNWEALQQTNQDVIGWLYIEGTAISTPIVKAPGNDPNYYLTHDLYREQNAYGCPYLDCDCAQDFSSPHCVIYGHNMGWDNALFADLQQYTDEHYALQHRRAFILTPHNTIELRICASLVIDGSETIKRTAFSSQEDFEAYRERLLAASTMFEQENERDTKPPSPSSNHLFTLCTCSYWFNPANERTLVFAIPA